MKNFCCLLFTIFIAFMSSFSFAANKKPVLNIQHWTTPNGAHVYFVRAPEIPMVDVQVDFAVGSAYDGKSWGLASFVNSMLNEGTSKQSANQIAKVLDSVGAQVSGSVNRDMAVFSLRTLVEPAYLKKALATYTSILTQSSFPEKAFLRVKNLTLASIQSQQQSPRTVAVDAFYHAVYGTFPYAHASMGTMATVSALTPAQAKQFYGQYYVARNADVVIVGDVTRLQAQAIANQVVKPLPEGKSVSTLVRAKNTGKSTIQHIAFPSTQNTIMLGQVGVTRTNPHYFPLIVGNRILGGSPLTSILFEQVRNERGLTYGVTSQFVPLQYRGPFVIALQTRAAQANDALKVVRQVLNQFIKQGPTQPQLEAAKQNMLGSFPLLLSTNQSILANVTNIAFYHLPLDYLDNYRDRIRAVTAKQVKQAFQETLDPKQMKTVMVGVSQ